MIKRLGTISLSAFLFACANYPTENLSSDLPKQVLISDLAYFPQTEDQCGPASLATLLSQRGIETTPEELRPGLYIPAKGGTLAVELKAQTRRFELLPYELSPNMSSLLAELAGGNAVLVMQNLAFGWYPRWHFAVAIGYDLNLGEIYLRSGPELAEALDLGLFDRTWARAGRWAMTVIAPDQLPETATAYRYISAVSGLEQADYQEAALTGYLKASKTWPDDAVARFGLANMLYLKGDYSASLQQYFEAVSIDPVNPDYWNNMSYALLGSQCPEQAHQSASCAVSLQPENLNFMQTLEEASLFNANWTIAGNACPVVPECPIYP